MDFSWSEEQTRLAQDVVRLTRDRLPPTPPGEPFWTRAQWQACGEFGLLGLAVPTEFGGRGLDARTTALMMEAFGHGCADLGLVFSAAAHQFACAMPIVAVGDTALQRRVLPRLCSGEWVAANAMTEKDAGSDTAALKARAVPDAGGYRISGRKSFASNGPVADLFVVYALTQPEFGWLGTTAFAVEADRPGLTVGAPFAKLGLSSCPAGDVTFEDCWVPAENRLGAEGQGARVFQDSMRWERACLFAAYVGMMDRQLGRALEHARTRRQFGKPLGKQQAVAHRLADMKLRLESARLLLYRACWGMDRGEAELMSVALAKLAISEAAVRSSLDAVQILGAAGYRADGGVEADLRDSVAATIFSGTSEIQRNLIATELGL